MVPVLLLRGMTAVMMLWRWWTLLRCLLVMRLRMVMVRVSAAWSVTGRGSRAAVAYCLSTPDASVDRAGHATEAAHRTTGMRMESGGRVLSLGLLLLA